MPTYEILGKFSVPVRIVVTADNPQLAEKIALEKSKEAVTVSGNMIHGILPNDTVWREQKSYRPLIEKDIRIDSIEEVNPDEYL